MENNSSEKGAFNDYSKLVRKTRKLEKKKQKITTQILELLNGESVEFAKSLLQQIIFCLDAVSTVDYKGEESKNSTDFLKGVFKGFSDFQKSSQERERETLRL